MGKDKKYCPQCGSDKLLTTLIGWIGKPEDDPNKWSCKECEWKGKIKDFGDIATEAEKKLVDHFTAYFVNKKLVNKITHEEFKMVGAYVIGMPYPSYTIMVELENLLTGEITELTQPHVESNFDLIDFEQISLQ